MTLLERLIELEATPRPWRRIGDAIDIGPRGNSAYQTVYFNRIADAELIVTLVNALPQIKAALTLWESRPEIKSALARTRSRHG